MGDICETNISQQRCAIVGNLATDGCPGLHSRTTTPSGPMSILLGGLDLGVFTAGTYGSHIRPGEHVDHKDPPVTRSSTGGSRW